MKRGNSLKNLSSCRMLPEKKRNTRKNYLTSKLDSEAGKKTLKCFKDHYRTACHTPAR